MCGRFTLTLEGGYLQAELNLGGLPADWRPRYNIAPSQPVAVVREAQRREVEWMRWGLVPAWAEDPQIGYRLINARAETVTEKPSFRQAFAKRRCLVLADGFYEWQRATGQRGPSLPYYFRLEDGKPFAFAGLWEHWRSKSSSEEIVSCTIITTQANERVAPVHPRMPVILTGEALWQWLDNRPPQELQAMLKPLPAEEMVAYPVSRRVNDANFDAPEVILPVAG